MTDRAPWIVLLALGACGSKAEPAASTLPSPPPATAVAPAAPATPVRPPAETLAEDTPRATVAGNTFIAPAGWSLRVDGPATILEAPEGNSRLALVDVKADTAEEAVDLAWKAYRPEKPWPLKVATDGADRDGWTKIRTFEYQVPPNEKRAVLAMTRFANEMWTVVLYDMSEAVGEKRGSQVAVVLGRLLPKGREKESFAGKKAHRLDAARVAELGKFVETARTALGVPGVSFGLVQDGKVVFAGGSGVRELGKPAKVDADTRFIIASNTKALTTLMLAKLVEEKRMTWDTPAASLFASFKLGDPDTTRRVLVKHLICACTGMPRQDLEWIFEFDDATPASAMETLGTMKPTSDFGALYQYSNPLAAAAGFIGGAVAYPKLELGRAYDEAMRTRVFGPLGMRSTTFDFKRAQTGNFAVAHSPDIWGKPARVQGRINESIVPMRPAGGAWSTVRDVLRYVQMELALGKLPGGKRYLAEEHLLARRAPQIAVSKDAAYGMGLMVSKEYDVTVVFHGGDMVGHHSDMMWLPDHGVGAVILTNGTPGFIIRSVFRRKLLEVLFDGKPEADARIAAGAKSWFAGIEAERKLLTIPADPAESARLADRYASAALGEIEVRREGGKTVFDFGELRSEVATRKNADGSISFITIEPGVLGFEAVAAAGPRPALTVRDAQHEYVFEPR
jgi:CubicO group peptidase (beta-lactamase class C family)